ncbi:conserved hypothetical protein [delta proteobacterium NaphS2]|nr:conserved hypothetical protein [delta proteobacterium NaphS2]
MTTAKTLKTQQNPKPLNRIFNQPIGPEPVFRVSGFSFIK